MGGTLSPYDFGIINTIREAGVHTSGTASTCEKKLGITFFANLTSNWVIRNITLDGNTFQESHHVEKLPYTTKVMLGCCLKLKHVYITFSHVFQSKEFKIQKKPHVYGSLSLTFIN